MSEIKAEPRSMRRSKRLADQALHSLVAVKLEKSNDDITELSPVDVPGSAGASGRRRVKKEKTGDVKNGRSGEMASEPERPRNVRVKVEPQTEIERPSGKLWIGGGADMLAATDSPSEMAGFTAKGGKFIGAHTSAAGGVWNAVTDSVAIQGRAFALFLKSQRQWKAKPLDEEVADRFRATMEECGYHPDFVLPHGSYLLNCGSPNPDTLQKSRDALLEEVQRCQRLGLNRYNFHPGSTCGEIPVDKCLDLIGESINGVLRETSGVTLVVENMSCQGNTVGGRFEELRAIIDRVEDKSRIGVCLDTCHAFAAGFDLSTEAGYDKMTDDFGKIVGFQYLKGVHLNDSKGKVGCHLDRHENIGKGFIGLKGFKRLMNDRRFNNIPMILETPPGVDYGKEIKLLYSLVN